jgi:rubrerythrin
MNKAAKRTIEKLNHFSCGTCGKWWTVGDAPLSKKEWHCPWCGRINDYEKNKQTKNN